MAKFPSLGANATVPDIPKMSPEAEKALLEMHEAIMRAASPLTPGQRKLIAAYVSGINRCQYCHGVHAETARAYDDDAGYSPTRARPLASCIGGHLTEPYEQNTQQSPGLGRSSVRQPRHS